LGGFYHQNVECWVPQAPRRSPESNLLFSLAQKKPVQTKSVRNGPCAFWTRKGVFCLSILVARCNPCFRSDGCRLAWPRRAGQPAPRGPDALVLAARPCGEPAPVSAGCTCCPAQGPFSARCVRPRGVCARRCWSAAGRPRSRAPRTRSHLAIAMRARRRERSARATDGSSSHPRTSTGVPELTLPQINRANSWQLFRAAALRKRAQVWSLSTSWFLVAFVACVPPVHNARERRP